MFDCEITHDFPYTNQRLVFGFLQKKKSLLIKGNANVIQVSIYITCKTEEKFVVEDVLFEIYTWRCIKLFPLYTINHLGL